MENAGLDGKGAQNATAENDEGVREIADDVALERLNVKSVNI